MKLPHGHLGDWVGFLHYPAVAAVAVVTCSASGIHWAKVIIFIILFFIISPAVITTAKILICF